MNNDVELIMLDKHNMKPLIDYINELQCYKERIEKAIKYIEKNKSYWEEWHYDGADIDIESDIDYIFNILKGEKKENVC